jgi:recombination protein RecR
MFSQSIQRLIEALCLLPGVGPRSAQRMALSLLKNNRDNARDIASSLMNAIEVVGNCKYCQMLSDNDICLICSNHSRDQQTICIVEGPAEMFSFESSGAYSGRYFVLMGHLSPLDGITAEDLGIDKLLQYIKQYNVNEVILATNSTVEGEATAYYIAELLKDKLETKVTRLAQGVPMGGELEFINYHTLAQALKYRTELTDTL